ncbi:MAG TPA: hypothetical protein DEV81_02510, partial [Cyanobacteria bacterium UBA11049]|nr:hypothetical protein [Cyanobacteria bacterium UBA11049]
MHLQRTLTPLETWGFGLTALINWITIAPLLQAAIGPSAIFVWLPGIFIGMMLNLQVKRLGEHFPNLAGGTPNYTIRLLKSYPVLGRYAASGYFLSWVATLPISALVLTQLIQQNLVDLGFSCPKIFLNIGFTILPLILAFSGTRALSILHAFFVLPTLAVLLIFSIQGLFWLATSPNSPGFFPSTWPSLSLFEWAKWFYLATYTFYGCDSAACFIADSRNPAKTLQFLKIAAWLMPPVIIGGAWVLLRGSDEPSLGNDLFLNLLAASKPFWGSAAFLLVTFLLAASALLSCATVVANCPRMLYQLAVDKEFPPVFGVVSRRGVFGPGLVLVLLLSLICLAWGNVPRIVAITNVGWVASLTIFHLGLWLQRGKAEVRWPCWSGGFFVVDAIVLVVGGLAWGWQDFTIGLLFPITLLIGDGAMRHIEFAPFHPAWWIKRYRRRTQNQNSSNFVAFQVVILIFLVASAVAIGWYFGSIFTAKSSTSANLLAVLLLCVTFVSVAIACWTSLPKVLAMNEAREFAEQLFIIALDAILVLDEVGVVFQANPAAERLFDTQVKNLHTNSLLGCHLSKLLPGLGNDPQQWSSRSEQILNLRARSLHIVEVAISNRFFQSASINDWQPQEYVVIVRDITERKQAEAIALRAAVAEATNQKLEQEIVQRQRVEAQLLHNAFHDVLTDLPNRALFLKQLQRALVRAGQQRNYRFAVLFLDLERFKLINDSLGHMLGDELLISIAQRWSSCLDQKDTIARLGGDE